MSTSLAQDEIREKAVEIARRHKASWIELGRYLYQIQKNKMFKYWGYLEFDHYVQKELGIRPNTGAKMLRSYQFLERDEPRVIQSHLSDKESPRTIPHMDSVNILRLAKNNKRITPKEIESIREEVFETAKEPKEVRSLVRRLLSGREEAKDPREARKARRNSAIKRLVNLLTNTRKELESDDLLPAVLLNQIDELKEKLQDQIEG